MGSGTAVATGDVITAAKMNLKLETIVDADITHDSGDWTVGEDGAGQDIIYYTDTAGRAMTWDPSDDSLEFDDDVHIAFGDDDDVEIYWNGSNLIIMPATDDTGAITIGDGTNKSMDFLWYGTTAAKYVKFDLGGDKVTLEDIDLYLGDTDYLIFGDGADITIRWTSALLEILPATDDTGAINIGNGSANIDLKIFLGAAGVYADFNVGTASLVLVGTAATILSITSTLTGATADNAVEMDVTDEMTISGGMNRALHINYSATGAQSGTAQINAIAIDMDISDNIGDWMPLAIYTGTVADKNIGNFFGISMYFEDFGNGVANFCALDIGYNSPHAPSGRNAFMRLRQHNTVQADSAVMLLEGNSAAGYFLVGDVATNLIETGDVTSGKTCTHGVRCKVGATVFVLAGYED